MIGSACALGRRALVARGWADLALIDEEPDCIAIGEVNQQALFARVAAVAHHGGAGTTTVAATVGAPQVVVPQMFDQHYYPNRRPRTNCAPRSRARSAPRPRRAVGATVATDGALVAARRLVELA
jgi:vancomycin aglycone glucosyltransferase